MEGGYQIDWDNHLKTVQLNNACSFCPFSADVNLDLPQTEKVQAALDRDYLSPYFAGRVN